MFVTFQIVCTTIFRLSSFRLSLLPFYVCHCHGCLYYYFMFVIVQVVSTGILCLSLSRFSLYCNFMIVILNVSFFFNLMLVTVNVVFITFLCLSSSRFSLLQFYVNHCLGCHYCNFMCVIVQVVSTVILWLTLLSCLYCNVKFVIVQVASIAI